MADYGVLLYGYSKEDMEKIKGIISGAIDADVDVISASGMEDEQVNEILEKGDEEHFLEGETKILMFLGEFTDKMLQASMQAMPTDGEIARPIFCTLTQKNFQWTFTELIEDLKKEEAYWKEQKDE